MTYRAILSLAALAAFLFGCQSWDEARRGFIEPFNAFLHRNYPRAFRAGDRAALRDLVAPDLVDDERFVAELDATLGRFTSIAQTLCVIEDVEWLNGDDLVRAHVALALHGVDARGARLRVLRAQELTCERFEAGWRIADIDGWDEEVVSSSGPLFAEEAAARGIEFVHDSGGVMDRWGKVQKYTPGSGLGVGDYDGDGWTDALLVGGDESRLYRNVGGGRFEDVTRAAGILPHPRGEGRCAVFADYDNDGDLDIFLGMLEAADQLYENNGDGTFTERARAAGLRASGETTGACFADFDSDGFLDLYVLNGANLLWRDPEPIYNALNAEPNRLYLSNGDGTFRDATESAGVGHKGWGLACSAVDYDLDGDMDLFVGNDFGFDAFYRNRGDATFEDVTFDVGLSRRGASMSSDWGDLDGDGQPDLFVAGMSSNSRWIIRHPAFPAPAPWYVNLFLRGRVLDIFAEMLHGNFLYRTASSDRSHFDEVSALAGVRNNGWAWSSMLLDFDNDGYLDVYGTNGFISGEKPDDL